MMMDGVRKQARDLKRQSVRYRPGSLPHLAIFGIRRGGSTLLADMIAAERGMWFVDEPFGTFAADQPFYHEIHAELPDKLHNQFFDMTPEESRAVHSFVSRVLSLELRIGTVRRARLPLVADRVAMKLLNTPLLIDWLVEQFDLRGLILTRHPGAQARSVLRLGWGFSAEAYFASDAFVEARFDAEQIRVGREILAGDDRWPKAILNWIIESWIPLCEASSEIPRLSYEELVVQGAPLVRDLFRYCELDGVERAIALLGRPSGSSAFSTSSATQAITAGDTREIVGRWCGQTTDEERRRGQSILDLFGVDLYAMDDPMPKQPVYTHFRA
jgi:hypothetical protein